MKSLIEKMDDIDDLFRDKPKASGCSMCGGDHDLDEECNMDESSAQSWAYHRNKAEQDNADIEERIARLRKALEEAKRQRDAGNEYAAQRVKELRDELHKLLRGETNVEEDYDNAPEEQYADFEDVATRSGNDLLKSKSSSPATAGGDNPLSKKFRSIDESREEIESRIRAELTALYKL